MNSHTQTLITFTSKAAADVVMLSDHAHALLAIIGKSPGERGVVTPEQIPAALTALRAAVGEDKAHPGTENEDPADRASHTPGVRLAQRAWPLIDMLERAGHDGAPVLWGV
jgi:hypothetical protein